MLKKNLLSSSSRTQIGRLPQYFGKMEDDLNFQVNGKRLKNYFENEI